MDGTVSSRSSEVGERVSRPPSLPGTEIMRVADLSKMEVRVKVNENDIVNVKVGDPVKITIDAYPDRKFNGVVREIGASADNAGASAAARPPRALFPTRSPTSSSRSASRTRTSRSGPG